MTDVPRETPWQHEDGSTNVEGFLTAYAADDNTFWRAEQGHVQNVLDAMIEKVPELEAEVERLRMMARVATEEQVKQARRGDELNKDLSAKEVELHEALDEVERLRGALRAVLGGVRTDEELRQVREVLGDE